MTGKPKKTRLIQKTSKTFLWISALLMLCSTIVLFFYVRGLLQSEVEEELRSTEARIENAILERGTLFNLGPLTEVKKVPGLGNEILKDTLIFDPSQNELEEFRELTTYATINGKNYRITVRSLVVESENILIAVVFSYLIIIGLVFLFLFYVNKSRNQKLWAPFFKNLDQMKQFSLSSDSPISLMESDILEFSELNDEITVLTEKVRSDFKNLKRYTEDVSHEIQTPLAIIQAKIENVINSESLKDDQFDQLTSIQKDIKRLTQMTKRLALLTKIENKQFENIASLDISNLLGDTIQNFNEITTIQIDYERKDSIVVEMDPFLAEVLCNNLVSNAIKYVSKNGAVRVSTTNGVLSVLNSGKAKILHPEKLFTRFYRETENLKSSGLGLAIVKQICDLYGYRINYNFQDGMHRFTVTFTE